MLDNEGPARLVGERISLNVRDGVYELTVSAQADSVSIKLDKYGLVGQIEHKMVAMAEKGRGALYRAATARTDGRDLRG